MKVAMIYAYDPISPSTGGGIRYVRNLIRYLEKKGIEVTLLGIQLERRSDAEPNTDRFLAIAKSNSFWLFAIGLFLKARKIKLPNDTIIHTHRTYFMIPFILLKKRNPKACTLHMKPLEFVRVQYPHMYRFVSFVHKIVDTFCLKRIDCLISVTDDVKSAYEERYPWLSGRINTVSGTGVDLDVFKPIDKSLARSRNGFCLDSRIILSVGRIEKIKNFGFLIRSFANVVKRIPDSRLVIAGEGSERRNLENLAQSMSIDGKIDFLGEIRDSGQMADIYNCADVLAISSLSEASPTVAREAIACGVPVIATNVGDIKRLVEKFEMGAVVDGFDETVFADTLLVWLGAIDRKNDNDQENIGSAHYFREPLGFDGIADGVLSLYEKTLKSRR